MANRNIRPTVFIGFLTVLLVGCTVTTNYNEGGNSIPADWVLAVSQAPKECVSIDGDYKTFGVGKFKEGEELTQARLDAALGYAFPSEKIPEHVGISLEQENSTLSIKFGDPVNRIFSAPIICSNGWYLFEETLTNQYLGDGVDLDYSISKIELGKSLDGDLILHLLLDIQSSSFLILKSRDTRETWSKYEEAKSEY
jgi:hypothetical protein